MRIFLGNTQEHIHNEQIRTSTRQIRVMSCDLINLDTKNPEMNCCDRERIRGVGENGRWWPALSYLALSDITRPSLGIPRFIIITREIVCLPTAVTGGLYHLKGPCFTVKCEAFICTLYQYFCI